MNAYKCNCAAAVFGFFFYFLNARKAFNGINHWVYRYSSYTELQAVVEVTTMYVYATMG